MNVTPPLSSPSPRRSTSLEQERIPLVQTGPASSQADHDTLDLEAEMHLYSRQLASDNVMRSRNNFDTEALRLRAKQNLRSFVENYLKTDTAATIGILFGIGALGVLFVVVIVKLSDTDSEGSNTANTTEKITSAAQSASQLAAQLTTAAARSASIPSPTRLH